MKRKPTTCPTCGSSNPIIVLDSRRDRNGIMRFCRCGRCETRFHRWDRTFLTETEVEIAEAATAKRFQPR